MCERCGMGSLEAGNGYKKSMSGVARASAPRAPGWPRERVTDLSIRRPWRHDGTGAKPVRVERAGRA